MQNTERKADAYVATDWTVSPGPDVLALHLNQNHFVSQAKIREAVANSDVAAACRYPDYTELVEVLAAQHDVLPGQITVSNGADQAIELAMSMIPPRRDALIASPVFYYYYEVSRRLGAMTIPIHCYTGSWKIQIQAIMERLNANAGAVIICNPSNPLSTWFPPNKITQVADLAAENGCLVIVDECYGEFVPESAIPLTDRYQNLLVIRTMSKGYGLPGIRLGYIVADAHLSTELRGRRGPWDVNGLAVSIALWAIRDPSWLDFRPEMYDARTELSKLLRRHGAFVAESATNFVVFRVNSSSVFKDQLRKSGILVADMNEYPESNGILDNVIRMAVPNSGDIDRVAAATNGYFEEWE